jgi:hypothetical protein
LLRCRLPEGEHPRWRAVFIGFSWLLTLFENR